MMQKGPTAFVYYNIRSGRSRSETAPPPGPQSLGPRGAVRGERRWRGPLATTYEATGLATSEPGARAVISSARDRGPWTDGMATFPGRCLGRRR